MDELWVATVIGCIECDRDSTVRVFSRRDDAARWLAIEYGVHDGSMYRFMLSCAKVDGVTVNHEWMPGGGRKLGD